jgi:hypothetical protein
MFNATHCKSCGKKEAKNGEGCNNSKCKEYYKLKGVKKHRTTSQKKETLCILCISCGNQERTIDDTGRCDSCRRELYERECWMCDFD